MLRWFLRGVLFNLLLTCFFSVASGQYKQGKVTGSVLDQMDAVIPGVEITVTRGSFTKTVESDSDGRYEINLDPGIYSIVTKQGWWFPVRRAAFVVGPDQTLILDLRPRNREITQELVLTKNGLEDRYSYGASPPKYEEFRPFADSELNVVIEYTKRKDRGRFTEFSGARLTYDATSISAAKIRVDKKSLRVEAVDHVTVDQNGKRRQLSTFSFSIERIEP